jgi:hypothetical protein
MTLSVHPSVCNVLDDESDEQAGNHDGSCSGLILNSLNAVIREEELCVREKLNCVSGPPRVTCEGKLTCTIAVEIMTPVPNWRMATTRVPFMLTDVNLDVKIGANTPMALVTRMTKRRPILSGTS